MATNDEIEKGNKLLRDQAENVEFIKDAFRSLSAVVSAAIEDAVDQMQGLDDMGARIAKSSERELVGSFKKLGNQLEKNVTIQAKILRGQNASKDIENARINIQARLAQTSAKIRGNIALSAFEQEKLVAEAEEQAKFGSIALDDLEKQNKERVKSISLFKITGGIISNIANKLDKSGALAELLKGDLGQITSERIGEAGVISAIDVLSTGLLDVSAQTTQFQKQLGLSGDKANQLRDRLAEVALVSGETTLNTTTVVNAFEALNSLGTANVAFSTELLQQTGKLETQLGMSADQQARFGFESLKSGKSVMDIYEGSVATIGTVEQITGLELDRLSVIQEAANVTGEIRAQLGFSIENIAEAIAMTKSFGMTLSDVSGVANNLLDFQSSIAAELEAELFTGKQLNLEKARLFSLTGEYGKLAEEIKNNVVDEYEFAQMNTLERRKYAQALGMSVDQLSDMIFDMETLAELEQEALDRGDKDVAQNLRALSLQQEFSLLVEKIQQSLVALADGPLGSIAKLFVNLMESTTVVFGTIGAIAGVQLAGIISGFMKLVKLVRGLSFAAAVTKAFTNPVGFAVSAALAGAAVGIVGGLLASGPAEDATIENGIITKKARGTMELTPFSSADQVAIGTNLFAGGGGTPSNPVVNISGVKITTDRFADRAIYSSGIDEQTAFS
tara:strand:- start:774 stop:2801 length:2028 start_codon:yes stop_codon:yes gene_type:complete